MNYKEIDSIFRKLWHLAQGFGHGDIEAAEYKKQLFLLAESVEASPGDADTTQIVSIIDKLRHGAEGDAEGAMSEARAIAITLKFMTVPEAVTDEWHGRKVAFTHGCVETDFLRYAGESIAHQRTFNGAAHIVSQAEDALKVLYSFDDNRKPVYVGYRDELIVDTSDFSYTVSFRSRNPKFTYPHEISE